jgi:hypothetical protein
MLVVNIIRIMSQLKGRYFTLGVDGMSLCPSLGDTDEFGRIKKERFHYCPA